MSESRRRRLLAQLQPIARMQSFILSVVIALVIALLALATGFEVGVRYQRDGVIFDPAAYAAPSASSSTIEAPMCFDICPVP